MQSTSIQVKVLLVDRFEKPKEWELEIPTMPPAEAADLVYGLSNMPGHALASWQQSILDEYPRTGLRSVSVGDMIIVQDAGNPLHAHLFTVEGIGFKLHSFWV